MTEEETAAAEDTDVELIEGADEEAQASYVQAPKLMRIASMTRMSSRSLPIMRRVMATSLSMPAIR